MKVALSSSLLALVLVVPAVARAQATGATTSAEPAKPATASEPVKPATDSAAEAAKAAAEAAKVAAEAAKASADALREAIEHLKAPPAPATAAVAAPAAPSAPPPWNFLLGVSFLSVSGNANALTGKLSGQAEGKFGQWGTKIGAGAVYGQTYATTPSDKQVTALNANVAARGQRQLSTMFNAYVATGALTDRVAKIAAQGYGEAGAGLVWFENIDGDYVKSKLTTDLGFRYTRESRAQFLVNGKSVLDDGQSAYQYLEDIDIYAIALKGGFRYAITKTAVFTEDLEVLPDVVNSSNLRVTSVSALSAQVDKGIALSLGFKARYIGAPATGAKPLDTELSAGVTWAF